MAPPATGKKVVGVGLACLDYLLLWQDVTKPVEGNRIVGQSTQGGGMIGTAMVAVARLGGLAEFWGVVGTDWMGDLILRGLADEHVDTSQVRRAADRPSPFVIVCVDQPTGQRHFLHFTGTIVADEPLGSPDRLRDAGCVLVDNLQPAAGLRAAKEARRLGIPVVGDLSHFRERSRPILAEMDYAIVSEVFAREAGGGEADRSACEAIRQMGPGCVVVTRGERGLIFLDGDRYGEMEAFDVDVVDTTGAGDTFHGAFCQGLILGLSTDENLLLASATAALKCRRLGGRAGIPSRREVIDFLAERGHPRFA